MNLGMPKLEYTVGIAGMKVSNRLGDILTALSLGSCMGAALYDEAVHIGGLLHVVLPDSKIDPANAKEHPLVYVDLGVPALIDEMVRQGAGKHRLTAKAVGGASLFGAEDMFQIGQRNYVALQQILWQYDIGIIAEDTGGNAARSMRLHIGSGKVVVSAFNQQKEL
jgi:chemotaxis protein CheD